MFRTGNISKNVTLKYFARGKGTAKCCHIFMNL